MSIRDPKNRNQSIKTASKDPKNLSQGIELGPGDDDAAGTVEYRESANDPDGTSAGMQFSKANYHLEVGVPQANRLPV